MNVADLLRRPGTTREVHLEVPVTGLENPSTTGRRRSTPHDRPPPREPVGRHRGLGSGPGALARGLQPVPHAAARPTSTSGLREVFEEDPIEDETYPLSHDEIDLEQPIRDLVVPELPLVPLCDEACLGLCPSCGANRNETAVRLCGSESADPRWEALRALVIPDDSEHRPDPN